MKRIEWIGSTAKDLSKLPTAVQDTVLAALLLAADGSKSDCAFQMQGDLRDVIEIRVNGKGGTYRSMYTTRIGSKIYVLHAFQKKSTQGIKTPQRDLDLIRKRLKQARADAAAQDS